MRRATEHTRVIDDLAPRIANLSRHEVMATGPMLARVETLLEDASRQYDPTIKAVLMEIRRRLVEDVEAAVSQERWVDVATAARITRRPEATVRYWCRQGLVAARKVGAREWQLDRQSLVRRTSV